jgi:DNA-binding beta-propeller fold protein YncE
MPLPERFASLALAAATAAFIAFPAGAQQFHRLESATVIKGAKPDWDYVTLDPARGYLFIGRRGDGVTVFDVKSKKVVRNIDKSDDANAIALVPEFDRGYTVNGDGTATMFQLSSLKTLERVKVGEDADSAFYEPVTQQLAFTMGDSRKIAFVDARTGKVVGELAMESKKLDGTVADGEGNLLMALRDRNSVVKIDVANRKVTAEWKTAPCEEPTGIAYDSANKRIFVGCRGNAPVLEVLDADSGAVVATMPIGRGNDGVIYDAATKKIYTSNGVDANLVVYSQVDPNTYKLAEATTTRPYARTMAMDPKTKKIYLVTAEGTSDPAKKINSGVAAFYPNRYFADTFTVLTYAPR